MTAKLTLSIDEKLISAIKNYSGRKHISISKLVENHFRALIIKRKKKRISAVEELCGILKGVEVEQDDPYYKKTIAKMIENKYKA